MRQDKIDLNYIFPFALESNYYTSKFRNNKIYNILNLRLPYIISESNNLYIKQYYNYNLNFINTTNVNSNYFNLNFILFDNFNYKLYNLSRNNLHLSERYYHTTLYLFRNYKILYSFYNKGSILNIIETINNSDLYMSLLYKYLYYVLSLKERKNYYLSLIGETKKLYRYTKKVYNYYNNSTNYNNYNYIWSLIFKDPILEKLTNFFILDGKKSKSEFSIYKVVQMLYLFSKLNIVKYKLLIDKLSLCTTKFSSIRSIKNTIYCMENPIKLIKYSISIIKPYVHIVNLPYGRKTRVVPSPIPLRKQLKYALRWIKEGSINIKLNVPLHIKILICLVNTYHKKGSAYSKYLEIHNQAFDNRAYINYNYQLRSKGTKKPNKDLYVYHSLKS